MFDTEEAKALERRIKSY